MIWLGRRWRGAAGVLLVLGVAASVLGVAQPVRADPSCDDQGGPALGYQWCGDHWRWSQLPVMVWVNTSGRPTNVAELDLLSAVEGAVQAWERAALALAVGPPSTVCPSGGRVLCYRGKTTLGHTWDGVTVVKFGTTASVLTLAETRICYVGTNCPLSGGLGRIKDADVTLRNSDVNWKQADPVEVAIGEATGARGFYCRPEMKCPDWHDIQSIVTHELGHVIGLEETEGLVPGCGGPGEWPGDLSDAVNYLQTMYPCHWKGHTNRRTLEAGDLLGLAAVLTGSRLDP